MQDIVYNARTKNKVHQGSGSCTPPAHKRLSLRILLSSKSQLRSNSTRSAVSGNQEHLPCVDSWIFTLSASIVETEILPSSFALQFRILDFWSFQIRQLVVVGDSDTKFNLAAFASGLSLVHPGGLTVCRQNISQKVVIPQVRKETEQLHGTD